MAAVTGCHPNYASFLMDKQTLHIQDIAVILNNLDEARRHLYNEGYIRSEYMKYMDRFVDDSAVLEVLRKVLASRRVILLAPGKSLTGGGGGHQF